MEYGSGGGLGSVRVDGGGWGGSFNHLGWCGGCDGCLEKLSRSLA